VTEWLFPCNEPVVKKRVLGWMVAMGTAETQVVAVTRTVTL
jgi:hypothetical protein